MGQEEKRDATPARPWDAALLTLYTEHFSDLVASAQRLIGCRMIAEEVVQDAFLKFHLGDKLPRAGRELAYLRSMALNNARSILRRASMAETHHADELQDMPLSTEEQCVRQEEVEQLTEALIQLPARQREVVWLRHGAGLSEQETAQHLAIGEGSVKTHAWRARAALRDAMSATLSA